MRKLRRRDIKCLARSHTARKQDNWDFQLGYWSSLDQPEEKNQEQEKKLKERSILQHPPLQGQKRNWEGECTGCPETWNRGKGSSLQILIKREGSPVESDLFEWEWEFKEVFKKTWGWLWLWDAWSGSTAWSISATASETPGLAALSHIHGQEPSQGTQSLNKQLSGIVLSAKKVFPTCVNR